jgi:hypothetical protein
MCCPPVDLAHVPRALFFIDSYNISVSNRQGHAKTANSTQNTAIKYIFSRKISPICANLAVKHQPTTRQQPSHAGSRARKRLNYNIRGPARPALACVLRPYFGHGDCPSDTTSQKGCHAQLAENFRATTSPFVHGCALTSGPVFATITHNHHKLRVSRTPCSKRAALPHDFTHPQHNCEYCARCLWYSG